MKPEDQIERIVAKVLKRLLPQLGADGSRGRLLVVFTAATVGFKEAMQQARSLILAGFQVKLVFSEWAERLYGQAVRDELEGFPHVLPFDGSHWLSELRDANAVVVPMLSVNTLSKLAQLVADNTPSNLLLHGLFLGKPVVVAKNGVDPTEAGRAELGFDHGNPALTHAIDERLQTIAGFGCTLVEIASLGAAVNRALTQRPALTAAPVNGNGRRRGSHFVRPVQAQHFITSADVLTAFRSGADRLLAGGAKVTPLARDVATKYGISLLQDGSGSSEDTRKEISAW